MKKLNIIICLFLLPVMLQSQIWIEDFDGSNLTNAPTWSYQSYCTSRDYLDIVCLDVPGGCTQEMNADYFYSNDSGEFLGARDTDHNGCAADLTGETVTFSGIDISACEFPNVVYLCFTVAESQNMGGPFGNEWGSSCGCEDTWDGNTSVMISASVDGGAYQQVTAIEAMVGSDTRPGIDVNCDGRADDPGEPLLTDAFTEYCFELPALGSTLDLELELIGFNTGGEDVAIDNIAVHCEADESTLTGDFLESCTPFLAVDPSLVWKENFDGSNTSTTWSNPCVITDSRDYFGIVCLSGCPDDINSDYTYANASGQFFGVRDMNGNPCGADIATFSTDGIDISSCSGGSSLYLCFDIAESNTQPREGTDTWDGNQSNLANNSFLIVSAEIDGGAPLNVMGFAAVGNNNSGPAVDSDCDGTGEGALLSPSFTTICTELFTTGLSMDLDIIVGGLNTDGDDVAVDNICVICTDDVSDLPAPTTTACNNSLVLPVEFSKFAGVYNKDHSYLTWSTISEFDNDFFEIQYSKDGINFTTVGEVESFGYSVEQVDYEFKHFDPVGEKFYYRIKQVDFNGVYSFSDVVVVNKTKEGRSNINSIYPVPATTTLIYEGEHATITFFDIYGKIVKTTQTNSDKTNINIENLDSGTYVLELIYPDGTVEHKNIIKAK